MAVTTRADQYAAPAIRRLTAQQLGPQQVPQLPRTAARDRDSVVGALCDLQIDRGEADTRTPPERDKGGAPGTLLDECLWQKDGRLH